MKHAYQETQLAECDVGTVMSHEGQLSAQHVVSDVAQTAGQQTDNHD